MKLKDLRIGNVVILRNGDMQVLRKERDDTSPKWYTFDKEFCKFSFECSLKGVYGDNLKHCAEDGYDIVTVYEDMNIYFDENTSPIWVRTKADEFTKGDIVWSKVNDGYILRSYCSYDEETRIYTTQPIRLDNYKERDYECIKLESLDVKPYEFFKLEGVK